MQGAMNNPGRALHSLFYVSTPSGVYLFGLYIDRVRLKHSYQPYVRAPNVYAVIQIVMLYHIFFMIIIVPCRYLNPRPAIDLSTKPVRYQLSYPGLDTLHSF